MRFIVTQYGNDVTMRLHPDYKRDIRNAVLWHGSMTAVAIASLIYLKKNW